MTLLKTKKIKILRLDDFFNMIKKVYEQPTMIILVMKQHRIISVRINNKMWVTAIFFVIQMFYFLQCDMKWEAYIIRKEEIELDESIKNEMFKKNFVKELKIR